MTFRLVGAACNVLRAESHEVLHLFGEHWVLNTARRPAVLVEMGYSTNPGDAKFMSEPASQRKLAKSLADAILAYLADYERKVDTAAVGDTGS